MNRYGLIGYPLSHSFSESYFAKKFQEEGITDCMYQNFPIQDINDINNLLATFPDLKGFNVTIPYKERILPFLYTTNDVVAAIGACNCVKIDKGQLSGHNTDVYGFETSLTEHLQPHHARALILGEGGAAKAVAFVLEKLGIGYISVVRKGTTNPRRLLYEQVTDSIIDSHTLIVNCTPLGTYPNIHECPVLNFERITARHYLFDLIYNPAKTVFLQNGERRGARIKNGYEMLVLQAEESWRIWQHKG